MQVPMSPSTPTATRAPRSCQLARKDDGKALPDLKETFQVCVGPEGRELNVPTRWPEGPEGFKDAMTTYYRSVEKLAALMMKVFACALKLPRDFFDQKIGNHMSSLRIL